MISENLVILLVDIVNKLAIRENSPRNALCHLAIIQNILTSLEVFVVQLEGEFGITDSAFALLAFCGGCEASGVFQLQFDDSAE